MVGLVDIDITQSSDTERNNRNARSYIQIIRVEKKKEVRERERVMKESISNVFASQIILKRIVLCFMYMLRSAEWIIKSVFRIKKINSNEHLSYIVEVH